MRLGADPEVFLQDKNKNLVSVIGKIGANKWNPKQISNMEIGFTLQEDNVALEFGIPPASTAQEFADNIFKVMKAGLQHLPGTSFSKVSCAVFPEKEILGCWTLDVGQIS